MLQYLNGLYSNSNSNLDEYRVGLSKQAINMFSLKGLRKKFIPKPIKPNNEYEMLPGKQKHGTQVYNSKFYPKEIKYDKTILSQRLRDKFFKKLTIDTYTGWVDRQNEYISTLSKRDLSIIRTYTYYGDVLVNGYCRHTLEDLKDLWDAICRNANVIPLSYSLYDQYDQYSKLITLPPRDTMVPIYAIANAHANADDIAIAIAYADMLYKDTFTTIIQDNMNFFRNPDNIGTLLEQYKTDLMRIIYSAPRLTSSLVVYRGINDEKHVTASTFKTNDFISTSVEPQTAYTFTKLFSHTSNRHKVLSINSGMYELTIHKNVPCMYISSISEISDESEVLLPPGINIKLDSKFYVKSYYFKDDIITVYGDVTVDSSSKADRKTRSKSRVPIDNWNSLKSSRKHTKSHTNSHTNSHNGPHIPRTRHRRKTRRWSRKLTPITDELNTFS